MLVAFAAESSHSLLDYVDMEADLSANLGRRVEVANRRAVEQSHNWRRHESILGSAHTIYAA